MYERIRKEKVALLKELKLLAANIGNLSDSQITYLKDGLADLETYRRHEPGEYAAVFICSIGLGVLCAAMNPHHYVAAILFIAYSLAALNACIEQQKNAELFKQSFQKDMDRMQALV